MRCFRWFGFLLFLAASPLSAGADEGFVDWQATSGPLPPDYAWSVAITISDAGQLALKHCKGFATEGKACSVHRAKVGRARLDAIRSAVAKADLVKRPMREMPDKPVGGSTVAATIRINGKMVPVSGFPVEADAERVGLVLRAIYLAVPERLAQQFIEGD